MAQPCSSHWYLLLKCFVWVKRCPSHTFNGSPIYRTNHTSYIHVTRISCNCKQSSPIYIARTCIAIALDISAIIAKHTFGIIVVGDTLYAHFGRNMYFYLYMYIFMLHSSSMEVHIFRHRSDSGFPFIFNKRKLYKWLCNVYIYVPYQVCT